MKKALILLIMIFAITSCTQNANGIPNITVSELKTVLNDDKNVQLLDVRTPQECAQGTIKNALEISVTADGFAEKAVEKLDKSKPVYIYCRSGGRSMVASKILKEKGYKVYNIEGGYMAWSDSK